MTKVTKEQYEKAKSDLDFFTDAMRCSMREIDKLLDNLCDERECLNNYKKLAEECRMTIISYETWRRVVGEE